MHVPLLVRFDQNEYFMTINIFVLKGDLNGKIVVVRFFFVGYRNYPLNQYNFVMTPKNIHKVFIHFSKKTEKNIEIQDLDLRANKMVRAYV